MDSFFSLFDPSDGQNKQNHKKKQKEEHINKKKPDAPKGRRRGRKSNGKHETLPEESSFLCEPQLSTEILVKDASYIENYIEINKRDDDTKMEDKKNKKRFTGRRSRRKKKSPPKDSLEENLDQKTLNNCRVKPKMADDNVGKNVNDLKNDFKKNKRKDLDDVIDDFENVGLEGEKYLDDDFEGLDDFSSSDEFCDDSASDLEDSSNETYGSLPPEPRFGNVEYKLQLVSMCERRFQHLVTQLKWRLRSGGGSCIYVVGVRDCGALVGLRPRQLRASLHTLKRMCRALRAAPTHITARKVAPHRAVAEVYIRKLADPEQSVELRVAVMGANEAGKSTLIGVLTQGELDNGRGSARLNMFRHLHEVKSGRTSSLSHEILGFDAQGNVVNYGCSELMTAERIGERSAKLVSFLDLAGHTKYQRTTIHGLTGYSPHYGMLLISATSGITPMTEEHLSLLVALDMQFFIVISKCELAPAAVKTLLTRLGTLLQHANKKPVLIKDENHARNCVAPAHLILDTIGEEQGANTSQQSDKLDVPVFPVSCVKGQGLSALHAYLLALQPPAVPHHQPEQETCEFQIDEIFHMGDASGPVVGGLLAKGKLYEGDQLIMGPLQDGSFTSVAVRSVFRNRVECQSASAGQCASLGLSTGHAPRPGMVLLQKKDSTLPDDKVNKNVKNILQDLAVAEEELAKNMESSENNVFNPSDSDENYEETPRGCIYFQANIQLQRHSTVITPGFQCTVHVGNVRQTAIIEGILSGGGQLRAGESAACVLRFVRSPEYVVRGRRLLLTSGLATRAIGRITQTFPYVP